MRTPCYISLEGETQGLITAGTIFVDYIGDVGLESHDDEMLCTPYSEQKDKSYDNE